MNDKTTPLSAVAVDPLVMRRRQREYMDATQPIIDVKVEIYSWMVPTIIIHPDGNVEHRYDFTSEQQEMLQLADEAIEAVKARIFDG